MITYPVNASPNRHRSKDRQCGRTVFSREAELPKLIGLWPSQLEDPSLEAANRIIGLLRKALRGERRRAKSGHWTYDLTRHLALSEALKAEEARMRGLEKQQRRKAVLAEFPSR